MGLESACTGYLGHPFRNRHVAPDGPSFLAEACEMRVQSIRPIFLVLSGSTPISRRRGSIRALYIHLNQATSLFQLSLAPRTFFALDQTTNGLPFTRHARRYDQRKIRTTCGKRPVTTPTDHPSSTNQAAGLPEDGPVAPGTSGQDGPNLETGDLHCPAGDASAASIVSSSVCSGSANRRRIRESRGSRLRRLS